MQPFTDHRDWPAFAAALRQCPRDVVTPGVAADWLDEDVRSGDAAAAARAGLIRAQLGGGLPEEIVFSLDHPPRTPAGDTVPWATIQQFWTGRANPHRDREASLPVMARPMGLRAVTVRNGFVVAATFDPWRFRRQPVAAAMRAEPIERVALHDLFPAGSGTWIGHGPEDDDGDPPDGAATRRRRFRAGIRAGRRYEAAEAAANLSRGEYDAVLDQMRSGGLGTVPGGVMEHYYGRHEYHLPYPVWVELPELRGTVDRRMPGGDERLVRNVFPSRNAALKAAWAAAFRAAWKWAFPGEAVPEPARPPASALIRTRR